MGRGYEDNDRLKAEQEERERNRRAVLERKRQWEVVDSDNDDDYGSDKNKLRRDRSSSRSRSRSRDDDNDSLRRRKKHKRKKHRRRYSSSDDSNDRDKKKEKRRHKDRKHKDKKKRRHKESSKKHKKQHDKARDKQRTRDDASYSSSSLSDNEREILEKSLTKPSTANLTSSAATFGKYGIIHYPSDFHKERVRRSFDTWLAEVKAVAAFTGPKHELMEYFKEYVEDHNTATLPHEKYYDYEKWEIEDYERQKRDAQAKAAEGAGVGTAAHLDEMKHRELMAEKAKKKKLEELKLVQHMMTAEKREEMKHQARLRHEMTVAYKTGDDETRKKLEKRLAPEDK